MLRGHFYEGSLSGSRRNRRSTFRSVDLSQVVIYFEGQGQGIARRVDGARLPSLKPVPVPAPEPAGINFVQLLEQKISR